jgi:membrane-associated phospholipid phosphatase
MSDIADTAEAMLDADAAAAQALKPYSGSLPVRMLEPVADLGDQPQMRMVCGAVILGGLVLRDARLAETGLRMLAAHTVATWTKDFVKHRVNRTRPRSMHKPGKDHVPEPGRDTQKEETSFPSGHSAGAAAVARAFARAYPEHALAAHSAGAALSLAQIPRCAHYPTDVGAGIAIGVVSEAATDAVWTASKKFLYGRNTSSKPVA